MNDVIAISAGGIGGHQGDAMAVTAAGKLWSWGYGGLLSDYKDYGAGATEGTSLTDRHSPILIMDNIMLSN